MEEVNRSKSQIKLDKFKNIPKDSKPKIEEQIYKKEKAAEDLQSESK